jgi:hypothetical protein
VNGREPFPELVMRPVAKDDVDGLVATVRGLSRQSMYQRFFTVLPDPTPVVARHLALVDHRDHQALVVLDGSMSGSTARRRPSASTSPRSSSRFGSNPSQGSSPHVAVRRQRRAV